MGLFDLFKRKTVAEKNIEYLQRLRKKTIVQEKKSMMHEMIVGSFHDSSLLDEHPNGEGDFGLVKSNPIPIYGIDNIPTYMDKLRYKYTSKSGSGTSTYNPVDFVRTTDNDKYRVGSKKPDNTPVASSTSSTNIEGHIDVYNLYSMGGEMLAKIYVNCYSLRTSNKVPSDLYHRDDIPVEKDSKLLLEVMKNKAR